LIIVDEPTAGLDPAERNRFHNLLCEIGENTIVILSTHIVMIFPYATTWPLFALAKW
jgi:ABC-type multidrug transport system ATPase subunit